MSGWNIKEGIIKKQNISEDEIWSKFNYVFSDSCRKRNTYKYGFIKALLDNLFNANINEIGVFFSYEQIFEKFTENYWNLVLKYDLRQMRPDDKSIYSKIESIIKDAATANSIITSFEFSSIDEGLRNKIIHDVTKECKRNVIGALYEDFDGIIYSFRLNEKGLFLNENIYSFMIKYKLELEKLNYYAWAKFLEKINDDNALVRVIDKLELATPRRENLSVYRELLRLEFEEENCFYCGKKLHNKIHVDHLIPWIFVKDDKLWNFVLACPSCNLKKNDRLPNRKYIKIIEDRNVKIQTIHCKIIDTEFTGYSYGLLDKMWLYAKMSGIKEYDKDF